MHMGMSTPRRRPVCKMMLELLVCAAHTILMVAQLCLPVEMAERRWFRLGDRIAERRVALRLSQREFAARLGKSAGYPRQVEGGWIRPPAETLQQIAVVLQVSYEELAELAGYVAPSEGEVNMRVTKDEAGLLRVLRTLSIPARRAGNTIVSLYRYDDEFFDDLSGAKDEDRHRRPTPE